MTEQTQILERYGQIRKVGLDVSQTLCKRLTKADMQQGGKALKLFRNGQLAFDSEAMLPIFMDYCIYNVLHAGRSVVQEFHDEDPYLAGSDEAIFLQALTQARYTLFLVQSTVLGFSLLVRDLVFDREETLIDVGLSRTTVPATLFASRIIKPDGITCTTGAAIPIGVYTQDQLDERLTPLAKTAKELLNQSESPEATSAGIATIIAMCLQDGHAQNIEYRSPGESRPRRTAWREEPGIPVPTSAEKVGRNDRCPCGSGKKFKHCHGGA